jgi:hypothetical protein
MANPVRARRIGALLSTALRRGVTAMLIWRREERQRDEGLGARGAAQWRGTRRREECRVLSRALD